MRTAHIITAGKHEQHIQTLLDTYIQRLKGTWRIEWHICKTTSRDAENNYFRSQLNHHPYIALDEIGFSVTSHDIAKTIDQSAVNGQNELYFLIGGSYGIEQDLLDHATSVWSLGSITLPHQLVRLILVEQLYRGQSIINGSSYHH